ncbi:MAG TPA: 50S ribosomal protein L9 [Candidatus Dormibacteraeota bacterium]|nr:50S ribosomal protein L9 [Candidatus Dormibacteraeota bacterium]
MKVILKQDVKSLGKAGQVVEVSDGYARNFLMPRNLAQEATKGSLADLEQRNVAKAKREAEVRADAEDLARRLGETTVTVRVKAGETGKLFGAVTNQQIADAIKAATGIDVDRHKIELDEPIKALGGHAVSVRLGKDLMARVTVAVEAL